MGFVQLARDTVTGSAVAIKFVAREHPSLAAGLLLREIGNQVCCSVGRTPMAARIEQGCKPLEVGRRMTCMLFGRSLAAYAPLFE